MQPVFNWLIDFFNRPFFIILGGISTLIVIISFSFSVYLSLRGILKILYRFGIGLAKRKIALFTATDKYGLKNILVDSKLFSEKNIIVINSSEIRKAEQAMVYLVHWNDFKNEINSILAIKRDATALVIFAPQDEGIIPSKIIDDINKHRNVVIVNFRGRLLNDILISMVTVSYG